MLFFRSLTALIFLTFLLRNANGKKTASRLCCFCMFSNNEFWVCLLSQKKRESASCERMLKLRLPRSGLDSMAPTRQKTGGGGHSPHGVFNIPPPPKGVNGVPDFSVRLRQTTAEICRYRPSGSCRLRRPRKTFTKEE